MQLIYVSMELPTTTGYLLSVVAWTNTLLTWGHDKFYFAFLYLDRRFPQATYQSFKVTMLHASLPVVVETYKIRVNASMVRGVGLEPTMLSHLGLNQAPMPIRVHPHIASLHFIILSTLRRLLRVPWLIFTRNSWLKPRYASSRRNCDRIAPKVSVLRHLAAPVGFEPTTLRLTAACSTGWAKGPYWLGAYFSLHKVTTRLDPSANAKWTFWLLPNYCIRWEDNRSSGPAATCVN